MVKTNIQTFTGEVEILSNLHVGPSGSSYLTANGAASNVLDITGNVGATFFVGDGGFLSNIATTISDIVNQGNVVSNVVTFEGNTNYAGVGLVTSSNVGIQNTAPSHTLSIGDKIRVDDNTVETSGQSVIQVDGRILATRFEGDGGLLSNIATTLESIVNQGNVSANVVKFSSNASVSEFAGAGLVTDSNVGIQNTAPTHNLSVGSNLHVNDTGSNVLTVHGNVVASNLNLGVFSITPAYGLNDVCNTSNGTSNVVQFQNATTSLVATSNITVGGNVTAQQLISTSNTEVGDRLKFSGSNVFVDTLRVADVAANIVTYDRTTGELLDSSGTFMNKFAVVSEQPPSDLFANATTVANHGGYTLTTSNLATNSNTYNAFDGTANAWVSGDLAGGYIGGANVFHENNLTQLSNLHPTQFGDWLAIEFPYKTTLRHMKLTPLTAAQFPASANIYATNNDLTWTEVNYWKDVNPVTASNVQTITVNATEQFKKYALVATKAAGNSSNVALQDWQLFTESFSIDGGKVAMAQQAATGGETVMDQHGPHGRDPTTPLLKKFPEIVFEEGKFDRNDTTNTYIQAGYTVTASDAGSAVRRPWNVFNENADTNTGLWQTGTSNQYDTTTGAGEANTNAPLFEGSRGAWIKLELPKKIKVKSVFVRSLNNSEKISTARILGSNDDINWDVIKDKYLLTYDGSYADTGRTQDYSYNTGIFAEDPVDSTTPYKYIMFQILSNEGGNNIQLYNLKYYGYEEDVLPLGDTSVDTTFTSIMNTPQTTDAQVYVDGSLGETFTNRVVGPTVSNTHTTYVSTEKYWELSGNVESNVTLEANTFLSGDAPHSISMWFNSSNLEANTSNSCIFSVGGTEEKFYYDAFDSTEVTSNTYEMHQQVGNYGANNYGYLGGFGVSNQGGGLSGDGSTFVVGVERDDTISTDIGAALVFEKDANGKWIESQKLLPGDVSSGSGSNRFGRSVNISKDGNYILVGHMFNDSATSGNDAGAAYLFRRNPTSFKWEQKYKFLGLTDSDNFGNSVTLSHDGTFVAIGEFLYEHNSTLNSGRVRVFKQTGSDGSAWDSGQILGPSVSDTSASLYFGDAINLSADGNYLIVGAYSDDAGQGGTNSGAAYVFHRNGANGANQWDSNYYKIENSDAVANSRFGTGVSLSEDGTYALIGAYGHTTFGRSYDGAAYVYTRSGTNTWGTERELSRPDTSALEGTSSGEHFGISVSMSNDGTTCVVGASYADLGVGTAIRDQAGAMYVYNRSGTEWILKVKKVPAELQGEPGGSRFGAVVKISTDGSYILSTAYQEDGINGVLDAGVAYIYTRDSAHGNVGRLPSNFKIQANTWHNLTYAYQGVGGSKVTYLDGRKISEDIATDTFGDYPPMPMTNFELQNYKVIQSNVHQDGNGSYAGWEAFDKQNNDGAKAWITWDPTFNNHVYLLGNNLGKRTGGFSPTVDGEYLIMEMPHRLKLEYFKIKERGNSIANAPKAGKIYASNDGKYWDELVSFSNLTYTNTDDVYNVINVGSTKGYNRFALVVTDMVGTGNTWMGVGEIRYYGHKENDLVRLPDPTNVLKYPHIAMTGPAQRGYVVSASGAPNSAYDAYHAFNNITANGNGSWHSELSYATSGSRESSTSTLSSWTGGGGGHNGAWLKIQLPNKIVLNNVIFRQRPTVPGQHPRLFSIVGSNNDTDWYLVHEETTRSYASAAAPNPDPHTMSGPYASTAWKYFAVVIRTGSTDNTYDHVAIGDWELYGTGVDSIPIQIGGGNIDKVANFRVYDKFVGEDQALEIWDAQKDEFGRAKSSMTLHKGRLGIGTTEPDGRLAVLDEPYAPEEFPPGAMRGYKYYFEGHGVFCASASSRISSTYPAWDAFDNTYLDENIKAWICRTETGLYSINGYTSESPANLGRYGGGYTRTPDGEFLILQFPYKAKISSATLRPRHMDNPERAPTAGYFYGSNDGKNWDMLKHFSGLRYETLDVNTLGSYIPGVSNEAAEVANILINATKSYSYMAIIPTHTSVRPELGSAWVTIGDLRYFGVREQEQSVLHDGKLKLTKNLDVSRIGPDITEYQTPHRSLLHMEFNTSLAIHDDQAIDTATSDDTQRNGTFAGVYYDPGDHSFNMENGGNYIRQDSSDMGGDYPHTFSFWFKFKNVTTARHLFWIGTNATYQRINLYFTGNELHYSFRTSEEHCEFMPEPNRWYHFGLTYNGNGARGTADDPDRRIYIDGVRQTTVHNGGTRGNLNLATGADLWIGASENGAGTVDGRFSMWRIWRYIALSDSEMWTLYKQGRVPKANNIRMINSTLTVGDFERDVDCHLQVAGRIRARGSHTSFTGQHVCFPDEPMEKGLIVSAKKNKYLKLNGGLDTGKKAITVDESLPIVSLSNVAQDKACFGVVSEMEKANTTTRKQVTGGFITGGGKTLGDNRAIVNSVGEGAIWVVDTNGPLESGDYITTSNVVGYGQKQDDDVLHNYTVAKITMDCDFTGSNVAVQTIKREETGLQTIMEDTWNQLVDYDRSSNTETQYSNTLSPSAYTDQPGYTPREVTTIVDYTDGSNLVSIAEWSNLESNIQNTYQSNTFTEIVDYTKFVSVSEWSNLTTDVQNTYSEAEITTYYQIQRGENVLDENGQLQFEDKTGATEAPYERRFLDASGAQTDEANAVHIAAFVGCTYHCG